MPSPSLVEKIEQLWLRGEDTQIALKLLRAA
jgi:hypothetical protein